MEILGQNQTSKPETPEAANGRFFFVDLEPDFREAMKFAGRLRQDGRIASPESEKSLDETLTGIKEKISNSTGTIFMAVEKGGAYRLPDDYLVNKTERNESVLAIPRDQVTAISPNPLLSGNGKDVSPVLDIRIRTSQSVPSTYYSGPGQVSTLESLGNWFRFDLDRTRISLMEQKKPRFSSRIIKWTSRLILGRT